MYTIQTQVVFKVPLFWLFGVEHHVTNWQYMGPISTKQERSNSYFWSVFSAVHPLAFSFLPLSDTAQIDIFVLQMTVFSEGSI